MTLGPKLRKVYYFKVYLRGHALITCIEMIATIFAVFLLRSDIREEPHWSPDPLTSSRLQSPQLVLPPPVLDNTTTRAKMYQATRC